MRYCLTLFLLISLGAHAELSKWVDAEGKVHYSDGPPPANAKAVPLNIPEEHAPSASTPPASRSLAEVEAELRKKQKAKEEMEQKSAQQQEKTRACNIARSNLKTLENNPPIFTYDDNGARSYLDNDARTQRTEAARKAVSQYCD